MATTDAAATGGRVPLSGAVNCRDIGGYATRDGRRVKSGLVFRSDSFAELTETDLAAVSALGLATVCDLRHESERASKPNRLPSGSTIVTHAIGFLSHRTYEMVAAAARPDASPEALRADIREAYRHFVRDQADAYRQLFALLLDDGALPILIHCTSGKDRTGMAIALILLALDVPEHVILRDYMLSNVYRRDLSYMGGGAIPPEMLAVMMEVDPSFLAAAFAAIDADWPSRDAFLADRLGLTPERRERLRATLLA